MNILDCVETWVLSLQAFMEEKGGSVRAQCSTDDRSKHSYSLNLRLHTAEADFIVWDSGEAELILTDGDGKIEQLHFDDLQNTRELAKVLERILGTVLR